MLFTTKHHLLYFFLILLPFISHAQLTDEYYKPGYKLIFYDDFNRTELDKTKWMTSFTWSQCLPGSLSYYTPGGNYSVRDGRLFLTAKKEMINGLCGYTDSNDIHKPVYQKYDYTSAVITSFQTFTYGYYECRFRVPRGTGFNAAFWLYGAQNSEIDVFEIVGSKPDQVQTTLHWQGKDPKNGSTQWFERTKTKPEFDSVFHTMAVLWTPDQLTWYLDGKVLKSSRKSQRIWQRHIPSTNLNLILDLGIGIIDPAPNETTPFPAHFMVDYVRGYSLQSSDTLQIVSQKRLNIKAGDSLKIKFDELVLGNQDKLYPHGYRINILPGAYYRVQNNYIIPFRGFQGKLSVPVVIDDGIRKSNVFNLEIRVESIIRSEKLIDPVIGIIYPPGNMEIIIRYNSDTAIFNRLEFLDGNENVLFKIDPFEPGCTRITRNGLPAGIYYLRFIKGSEVYIEKVEFK
jgi:beta-glucanase (GH16 family)